MLKSRLLIVAAGLLSAACGTAQAQEKEPEPPDPATNHIAAQVVLESGQFTSKKIKLVPSGMPKQRGRRAFPWKYVVLDSAGRVLFERGMPDPTRLRGEFHGAAEGDQIDAVTLPPKTRTSFIVHLPLVDGATVEFRAGERDQKLGEIPYPGTAQP